MSEIVLSNEHLQVGILPQVGGSLSFLKYHKGDSVVDILRPADKGVTDPNNAAMFLMAPYCGRIRGGSFVYWGITRKVPRNQAGIADPIHGDAWKAVFEVVSCTPDRAELKMSHGRNEGGYPFSYDMTVVYALDGHRLTVRIELKNTMPLPIPCGMGVHPYFNKTKDVELDFKTKMVWSNWSDPIFDKPYVTPDTWQFEGGQPLKNAVFDTCFGGFNGEAKVNYPEKGVFVTISADPAFGHVVLYAPKGKGFFCLEPCTNAQNAFNLAAGGMVGTGIQSIGPNQTVTGDIVFDIQG